MVRNTIDDVDAGVVLESLAREVRALKAPGNLLFASTLAEAVATIHAKADCPTGEAAITADFSNGDVILKGDFRHLLSVTFAGG